MLVEEKCEEEDESAGVARLMARLCCSCSLRALPETGFCVTAAKRHQSGRVRKRATQRHTFLAIVRAP